MSICMQKIGMTQTLHSYKERFADKGGKVGEKPVEKIIGATWLICEKLLVLAHKTKERDGYSAMVLGFGMQKLQRINKAQRYLAKSYPEGFAPAKIYEHRTETLLPIGEEVLPEEIFKEGNYVDVVGHTKGRGFTGVMKAWNFHGARASHGVSKAHRTPGSCGGKRAEGRVMPGKKMPKNYGNEQVTGQNLKVVYAKRVNLSGKEVALIGLHGGVPGCNSRLCYISAAVKKAVVK